MDKIDPINDERINIIDNKAKNAISLKQNKKTTWKAEEKIDLGSQPSISDITSNEQSL